MGKPVQIKENEMTLSQINLFQSRLFVYELLQSVFTEQPTQDFLGKLASDPNFKGLAEVSPGAKRMAEFLNAFLEGNRPSQMESLQQDYRNMLVGPAALPAPLWESVFLDREHLMFGEATWRVRQFYARFGLSFVHLGNQPEDHIAIELDFMATLIRKALACQQQGDLEGFQEALQGQMDFLNEHLLRWAPAAFKIFSENAATPFYQGAGQLLSEYLPFDLDLLQGIEEEESVEL